MRISVPGHTPSARRAIVNTNGLASNFFRAMELPLSSADFTEQDTGRRRRWRSSIRAFVRMYFDGENPVGALVIPGYADRVEESSGPGMPN